MLERQIMFKQLQELQRKKKLQESKDSRQQNVMGSLMHNKQSSGALYGLINTGIPVRDPSQMFIFGDTNFVQGLSNRLVSSQSQTQVMQPMGQYSQSQGLFRESSGFFGPVLSQGLDIGGQTRKVQQVNSHDRCASPQEFGEVREDGNQDLATLDPSEQNFLFNMEDNSWGTSFSKHDSVGMESSENMFENKDNSSDLPSLQSGSWSALMQSAVAEAASGSNAGVQEEWSGLSIQNPEISNENQPSNLVESGKHPTSWLYNKSQKPELLSTSNASSSFHGQGFLPEDATFKSDACSVMPGFMDRSARFPSPNLTAQASRNMLTLLHKVDKEYNGTQAGYTGSAPMTKVPKGEPDNEFTPSYNDSSPSPYFGLRLVPPSQRALVNSLDSSRISQQAGHPDKPFQGPQSDNNQIQNQNYMTNQYPMLTVKNEDSQQLSALEAKQHHKTSGMTPQVTSPTPPTVWVDVPVQQNLSGLGSFEPPSTPYHTNSKMETAFKASKGLDCWKNVKKGNTSIETDANVINLQGLEDRRGSAGKTYFGNESLSGNPEANLRNHTLPISPGDIEPFGCTLKQTDAASRSHSPLNPMNHDPNTRTMIKNGRVRYDSRVPQTTSLPQLTSASGDHTIRPISSQLPLQDVSLDTVRHNKAPSWLKNQEASKTEQMLSMNDARIGNYMARIMAGGSPRSLERNSYLVQVANDQCRSTGPITVTDDVALTSLSSIYSQHLDMANQNMVVLRSKKRKFSIFERLPWYKEVSGGCSRLHDMSTAELEWTCAANRLPEKLEENTKVHWKRRLILTTQLMQIVFLPAPAVILSEDATGHCDSVIYYAAKLALGDACSLASRSYRHHDISRLPAGNCMTSESCSDQDLSKAVEGFIDRLKSLEEELSRLEKGESLILDIKVEFQDLEKNSVINRFAKFHTRGPLVTPDTASSGGASAMPKLHPQRYVKASAMPSTVPEGHRCLSL